MQLAFNKTDNSPLSLSLKTKAAGATLLFSSIQLLERIAR
jgi:hypothetical protein